MTKSRADEEESNRKSLRLYRDTSYITTMGSMDNYARIIGSKNRIKFPYVIDPEDTTLRNMIEIKTTFENKDFNLVLVHNALIEKRFYRNAQQLRKIMHPYYNPEIQRISEIRVSPTPNSPVCFKVKDEIDGDPALWFVVAPITNTALTRELLEQIKKVAE